MVSGHHVPVEGRGPNHTKPEALPAQGDELLTGPERWFFDKPGRPGCDQRIFGIAWPRRDSALMAVKPNFSSSYLHPTIPEHHATTPDFRLSRHSEYGGADSRL